MSTYTVARRGGCVLVNGSIPAGDLIALCGLSGKGANLSPNLARLAGATFAWGTSDAVAALTASILGATPVQADPLREWMRSGEQFGSSVGSPCDAPVGTITAGGGGKTALVSALLAKHYTGVVGSDVREPVGTVTSVDHHSVVSANLIHMGHGEQANGAKRWSHGVRDIEDPLNTVTASGMCAGLVTAHLTAFGQNAVGGKPDSPAQTVLAGAPRYGLVTSNLAKMRGDNVGSATDEPLHTVSAQGTHHAEVRAFLIAYYSTDQAPKLDAPAPTIPTHDRFGLVTVHGELYEIADIGLRMLQPRELFRAQGFPDTYIIDRGADGKALTKTAQVRMCGNSVCPPLAKALVEANVGALVALERTLAEVA